MEFTVRHDGRELGPDSEAEVKHRLSAGTLAPSDLALAPGANEWAQLSTFPQFLPVDSTSPLRPQQLGAYTAATLQPDESPLHQTHIHWIALSGAVIGALLCLIVIVPVAMFASWRDFYWAWLLLVIPVGLILSAAITVKTSELVITDRRVLIKVGFIQ